MAAPKISLGPFSGELPRPDSAYRKVAMADVAIDCWLDTGALRPVRADRQVLSSTGTSLLLTNCCVVPLGDCMQASVADVGCNRVFASGINVFPQYGPPDEVCNGLWTRMDWPCDMPRPSVAYTYSTVASGQPEQVLQDGTYVTENRVSVRSYFYTLVNVHGDESQPSEATEVVVRDFDDAAVLSGFPIPDPDYRVTHAVVYALMAGVEDGSSAVGGGESMYYRIGIVQNLGTSPTFLHYPATTPIQDVYVDDYRSPIPTNARDLQWLYDNRIAFLSDERLMFTEPGNYTAMMDKYTLAFADTPKRFIATPKWGYVLTCGRPEVVDLTKQCDGGGCKNVQQIEENLPIIGHQSPCTYMGAVFYASVSGVVAISGHQATVITDDVFSQEQWDTMSPHELRLAVHHGHLYILGPFSTYRMKLAATPYSKPDGGDLVQLSIRARAVGVSHDDRLIYCDANGTWDLGQGSGFKPYTWSRRYEFNRPVGLQAIRATHRGAGLNAVVQRHLGTFTNTAILPLTSSQVRRMGGPMCDAVTITLSGTSEVTQTVLGTSPYELD